MKILIVDNYYPEFLKSFENSLKNGRQLLYNELKSELMDEMFGTADFYSKNLKTLGHEVEDVVINFELLQKKWARENGIFTGPNFITKIPFFHEINLYNILESQIKKFKPDVLYIQCIGFLNREFLLKIKKNVRLIVGQIACPLPPAAQFEPYDLVISSLPNIVKKIKDLNVPTEYLPLSFESSILDKVSQSKKIFPCTFVGGISKNHLERYNLLKNISEEVDLHLFGYGKNDIEKNTKMYKNHHGEVWGREMYNTLMQSKITINKHIDIAENFANNMRLYEATGMGTLLLTDKKDNLCELFEVGEEVVAYKNNTDLIEKIKYYINNESERERIAKAGQARTLRDHTYLKRMKELDIILKKYLNNKYSQT